MPPAKSVSVRSDTCTDPPVIAIVGLDGATWDLAGPLVERTRVAITQLGRDLPVAVGIGVSTGDQAAEVAAFAAEAAGMSRVTLHRVERGEPDADALVAAANAMIATTNRLDLDHREEGAALIVGSPVSMLAGCW